MVSINDVTFNGDNGVKLAGKLFTPSGDGPHPAISMAHGYAGTIEHGLEPFAKHFAAAGFVVLLHDHRNFGRSEGLPRGDIDPLTQVADWRFALSYLESLAEVDAERIGIWGTSYAGGHVLVLAATDRRVRCVVSQVPTISGYAQGLRRVSPEATAALEQTFIDDDRGQFSGLPPVKIAVVSSDTHEVAAYRSQDAIDFYTQPLTGGLWDNQVTLRSTRAARMYEPGNWIERISPTPLLMIVATEDFITMTDLALSAFEQALQPKKLQLISGGHFDPYQRQFNRAVTAATEWFTTHLVTNI